MCGTVKCLCEAKICKENKDKDICPCSKINNNMCACKNNNCGPK